MKITVDIDAPLGYEFVIGADGLAEYRPATRADAWMSTDGLAVNDCSTGGNCAFILRRKQVLKSIVFDVTGPKRCIATGEHYLELNGMPEFWHRGEMSIGEFVPLSAPREVYE